ncbi:MAG: amidohydrolase family protein [Gammaproteobacteria bacterium]|nr:MAG: amidohydrolase family protein [Gammaproteobacteria bacterium]
MSSQDRNHRRLPVLGALWLSFAVNLPGPASAEIVVLQAARLLEVETGRMLNDATVVVLDGRIVEINPDSIPQDARVVDLGDRTLMPGLIDCHVHLTANGRDFREQIVTENAAMSALRGAENARRTLMAGFTTVRDLTQLTASPVLVAVALRDASEKGWISAPHIIAAGHALSITGGQIDPAMWVGSAEGLLDLGPENGVADGVDEVVKAVRFQIKHGAGVIKVAATAGIMSLQGDVGAQQYSAEELRAIVEEASRHNIRVAAHAQGVAGINAAILAGVASIEHGSMLDEDSIRLMKKNGTYLVPTTSSSDAIPLDDLPTAVREKARYLFPLARENLAKAIRAGVKIAVGSDAPLVPHGENAIEIVALVERGMTPLQAIQAATIGAADLLDTPDRGRIQPELLADIIAVNGDPLEDIGTLSKVAFVMKAGRIYKLP